MDNFTEDTQETTVTAAHAAVTASEQTSADSGPDEDVVISSFLVSTVKGETAAAAATISAIEGIEVHETHDTTLVVTIEAPTIAESTKIATEMNLSKGVISVRMIFANFEDDPVIKRQRQAQLEKKAQQEQQAQS